MTLSDWNPGWPALFESIRAELAKVLTHAPRVEHVGSTSIPGMRAKPIIDIDAEIPGMEFFAATMEELSSLGYGHSGDQGIAGREVFRRRTGERHPVLDGIAHHLYVCASGSRELVRHLAFRDFLRTHPDWVERYNGIKAEIVAECGESDRAGYARIKEERYGWFFEEVIGLSLGREK